VLKKLAEQWGNGRAAGGHVIGEEAGGDQGDGDGKGQSHSLLHAQSFPGAGAPGGDSGDGKAVLRGGRCEGVILKSILYGDFAKEIYQGTDF
jgi:hypothetical protein